MRVLRLGLGDDRLVDLHPSVSVVTGLTDGQRRTLRRAFDAIGTGLEPQVPGLLEAHGLLLDATQDDLDLLEVPHRPARTVATSAQVPGALPAGDANRVRDSERDVVRLASERHRASDALALAEAVAPAPGRARLRSRVAEVRARLARHRSRDAEPVRIALDEVRDRQRSGAVARPEPLADALADVGLEVRDLGLPLAQCVRLAEDWLDERQQEAAWVVGAEIELQGILEALAQPDDGSAVAVDLDELRRRARRATDAHRAAVDRADELRRVLTGHHDPRPTVDQLVRHLEDRLAGHRPEGLAGAVPMLLDGVLAHLGDDGVTTTLDRLTELAGSVQLVVVDDHPATRSWADGVGARRAAVVTAAPPATPGVVA